MASITLNMDKKFQKSLQDLVIADGGTEADVISRALASYQFLKSQVSNGNSNTRISITDSDGKILKNVTLP